MSRQGKLAREHVSTQDTLAGEHVSTQGVFARKHIRHVGTWAREARNLADLIWKSKIYLKLATKENT